MAEIEYFYSAHSAFAFLGSAALLEVARRTGRTIAHKPVELAPAVAAGGATPTRERSPAHRAYYFGREIKRWAEHRGVAVLDGIPTHHYKDYLFANRMLIAATDTPAGADALSDRFLSAHWQDDVDLSDRSVLAGLAQSVGHDAAALMHAAETPDVQARLEANTAEAIRRSVFGSPTYFVDGDMFYGQDRLELVERACGRAYAGTWPPAG